MNPVAKTKRAIEFYQNFKHTVFIFNNFKGNPALFQSESVMKTSQLFSWSYDFGVLCLRRGQVHGRGRSITFVGDMVRS